jgi:hypothetical protein
MQRHVLAPAVFMCEYEFLWQDDATVVTADNLVSALPNLLGQQIISRLLWSAILPELKPDYCCQHIL